MRIRELAIARPRFGHLRIHVMVRQEGWAISRKWVHRLYRLEGLQVRMRSRRRNCVGAASAAPNAPWRGSQSDSPGFAEG
jgi:putative transposase